MGVVNVSQFFGVQVSLAPASPSETERQGLVDIERIAKTLARQAKAPLDQWPVFFEPAESLIRLSKKWTEGC